MRTYSLDTNKKLAQGSVQPLDASLANVIFSSLFQPGRMTKGMRAIAASVQPSRAASSPGPSRGAPAPDFVLTDSDGHTLRLSDLWRDKPLVLIFLRHFGCIFCREQLALVKADYRQFREDGGEVACVGQGSPKVAKAIKILLDLPFPVLTTGDDLSPFRAWGLGRAALIQLLSPAVLIGSIRAMLRGHAQSKVIGDGLQMAGAFVIDRQGIVRYAHRNKNLADHVPHTELLTTLKSLKREK